MKMVEIDLNKYSDIDGISLASRTCVYCKLNFQEEFMIRKLCQNCRRLFVLYQLNQMFSKMIVPSILLAIIFYVVEPFNNFAYLPPTLVIGPAFLMGALQQKIHFRGLEENFRIIPLFRYSKLLNDNGYYKKGILLWNLYYDSYSEIHQKKVLNEFVLSILNQVKSNPMNWIDDMSNPTNFSDQEFIQYLFDFTEIRDAFSMSIGTGTLPDIWPHVTDVTLKEEIIDLLSKSIESIDEATDIEKKLFLEDLYLIEDDLEEIIESNPKWNNILDELAQFEAEVPPKNMFEEVKMNSQSQSDMQQLIKN
ncbi:MAG: hypothetical protein HeimC2_03980 [Candidatus Heimdallarchaeota archaeon LC_2]|nr:MAG: hypothetical protein HeimC2_03980 [Candidatus Heimdallarchaeota archaeon LC_2]